MAGQVICVRQNVEIENLELSPFDGDRQLKFYIKIRHSALVEFCVSNLNQALQPKTIICILSSTCVMTLKDFLTSGNYDIKNDPKTEMINIKSENKI